LANGLAAGLDQLDGAEGLVDGHAEDAADRQLLEDDGIDGQVLGAALPLRPATTMRPLRTAMAIA
jgi:hypothetical protein